MRNIENYINGIYDHVPEEYSLTTKEMQWLHDRCKCRYEIIDKSWAMGFMAAYNAAKRGKLDFQQALK